MKRMLLVGFVFLSGCSGAWVKPGSTQAEFNRDSYECERDQRMVSQSFQTRQPYPDAPNTAGAIGGSLTRLGDTSNSIAFFFRCMESKGYVWQSESSAREPEVERVPIYDYPEGTTYEKMTTDTENCITESKSLMDELRINACMRRLGYFNPRFVTKTYMLEWRKANFGR